MKLTSKQFATMCAIEVAICPDLRTLAGRLSIPRSSAGNRVTWLANRGLVKRVGTRLLVTDEGRAEMSGTPAESGLGYMQGRGAT